MKVARSISPAAFHADSRTIAGRPGGEREAAQRLGQPQPVRPPQPGTPPASMPTAV